ncbi:MAG: hypothetical protein QM528_07415 [Phycisphaerales bacterium]|nr:hypothetical protein [Phycisphaerales bacterium]
MKRKFENLGSCFTRTNLKNVTGAKATGTDPNCPCTTYCMTFAGRVCCSCDTGIMWCTTTAYNCHTVFPTVSCGDPC